MNNDTNNNPFNFKPDAASDPNATATPAPESVNSPAPAEPVSTQTSPAPEPAPGPAPVASPAQSAIPEMPSTPEAPVEAPSAPLESPEGPSIPEMPSAPVPPAEPAPEGGPVPESAPVPAPVAPPAQSAIPEMPSAPVPPTEPAPEGGPVPPATGIVNKIAESTSKTNQTQENPAQNNVPNPSSPEVMFRNEKQQMAVEEQRQLAAQNVPGNFNKDELVRLYVGKNYDKVMTKRFNLSAFFFGAFYLGYRKMLVYAVGIMAAYGFLRGIVVTFLPGLGFILAVAMWIAYGLLFNKFYINFVNTSVDSIIKKSKDMEEAKRACQSEGGTSVVYIFLIIVISGILSAIIGKIFPATLPDLSSITNQM